MHVLVLLFFCRTCVRLHLLAQTIIQINRCRDLLRQLVRQDTISVLVLVVVAATGRRQQELAHLELKGLLYLRW